MDKGSTKEKILTTALELFSQRGYSAVSIRDICARVGIKESTVYYHFKNKQDIFDELTVRFLELSESKMSRLTGALGSSDRAPDDSFFERVGEVYIEEFLLDGFCIAFIRTLSIEKPGSEKARELYDRFMFEIPLEFQSGIFAWLMEAGELPPSDSSYMAVRYYAPVYLYYQRYILSGELTEEKKELFRQNAKQHFIEFMKD